MILTNMSQCAIHCTQAREGREEEQRHQKLDRAATPSNKSHSGGIRTMLHGRQTLTFLLIGMFVLAGALWFLLAGWIVSIWSAIDAARWEPEL